MPKKSAFRQRVAKLAERVFLFVFAPCYWIMYGEFKPPEFATTTHKAPPASASKGGNIAHGRNEDEEDGYLNFQKLDEEYPATAIEKEFDLSPSWF